MRNPFRPVFALALAAALGLPRAEWKSVGPYGGYAWQLKAIGGNLLAIAGSGIWRSADGGVSWKWAQTSLPYYITDVAGSDQGIYAVNDGVFRSGDGGQTWEHLDIQAPAADEISMRVGQTVETLGRFLIVGTSSGLFRSADGGKTWVRVDGYPAMTPIYSYGIAVQGANAYVGTSYGLFASSDSGAAGSWKIVAKSPDGNVGVPAAMGRYVFVDGWDGLMRSANRGLTWDTLSNLTGQALLPHGKLLYRATGSYESDRPVQTAFHLSRDSGATWELRSEGMMITKIAARGDSLFVCVPGRGVMRSIDSGRHFEACPLPASFLPLLSASGNRILAPGDRETGNFASADGGATWTATAAPGSGSGFANMAVRGGLGFAIGNADTVFTSKDSGLTWRPAPGKYPVPGGYTQAVAVHAGALFLAVRDGIYRSADTGATWTELRPKKAQSFLEGVVLYSTGPELLLWDITGMYRSSDTGSHWIAAQKSPTGIIRGISQGRDALYAVGRGGVFRSADGGQIWAEMNHGDIRFHFVAALEDGLLASNDSLGMFISKDGGAEWSAFNAGLPRYCSVTSLSTTATDAYIGVGNAGIWRRPLAEMAAVTGLARPKPDREFPAAGLRLFRSGSGLSIEFGLGRPGRVRLEVFDQRGRRLAVLVDGPLEAGRQSVNWPAGNAPGGLRILRLQAEGRVLSRVAAE